MGGVTSRRASRDQAASRRPSRHRMQVTDLYHESVCVLVFRRTDSLPRGCACADRGLARHANVSVLHGRRDRGPRPYRSRTASRATRSSTSTRIRCASSRPDEDGPGPLPGCSRAVPRGPPRGRGGRQHDDTLPGGVGRRAGAARVRAPVTNFLRPTCRSSRLGRGHGIRAGGEIPWERSSFRRLSDERSMALNFIVTHSDGPL